MDNPKAERQKCEKCGACSGHAVDCPDLTLELARVMILESWTAANSNLRNAHEETRRMRRQVCFWQGKFHAVKHENNQLRKRNELIMRTVPYWLRGIVAKILAAMEKQKRGPDIV